MFFSEEKNLKTFTFAQLERYGYWPDRGEAAQKLRGFWFFSEEKYVFP
jgi:hypothetical protein